MTPSGAQALHHVGDQFQHVIGGQLRALCGGFLTELQRVRPREDEKRHLAAAVAQRPEQGVAGAQVGATPHVGDDEVERAALDCGQRRFRAGRRLNIQTKFFEGRDSQLVVGRIVVDPEHGLTDEVVQSFRRENAIDGRPIDEHRIDTFARAFDDQRQGKKAPTAQDIAQDLEQVFVADSFRPPQLLRLYQALAGRRDDDRGRHGLRKDIRTTLKVNATMPVGAARMSLETYLATLDRLARRDEKAAPPGGVDQVLGALAQRREELLNAARQDRFHWHALIRPAELVDFDLLALVLAGVRRGGPSYLAAEAFAKRDPLTALPVHAAEALQ